MKKLILILLVSTNIFAASASVGEGKNVDCKKIEGVLSAINSSDGIKTGVDEKKNKDI